jgi:hypothetical protein
MQLALFVSTTIINKRISSAILLKHFQHQQRFGFFASRFLPSTTTISILSLQMSSSSSSSVHTHTTLANPPTIPLRNGMQHPAIGFGTYKVGVIPASASSATAAAAGSNNTTSTTSSSTVEQQHSRTAREIVAEALKVGYRFLECAEFYGNEAQVGQAIADSGIARKDLFLCSKVWTTTIEQGPEAIRAQLDKTLSDLGTDYLDLYVMLFGHVHYYGLVHNNRSGVD